MYLKDYERKVILEKEGKYEDEENSDGEEEIIQNERAQSPTYMDEQRQIRESFRKFVEDSDDDKEEEEGTTANLLTKRMKTEKEQEKEEEEYIAWLKGQKDVEDKDEVKEMVSTEEPPMLPPGSSLHPGIGGSHWFWCFVCAELSEAILDRSETRRRGAIPEGLFSEQGLQGVR
ncbi:hypothetical protein GDO81_027352 [Engystomops pustulosus]|uniref:Uncharacterized protein n=1 Tax=Engystomops pustulosus TaxID=76066 RepID=A0AAV6YFY1_ENGPU|nr:hypothetical protein GDO81_027352 [Engystomops pustulosus]